MLSKHSPVVYWAIWRLLIIQIMLLVVGGGGGGGGKMVKIWATTWQKPTKWVCAQRRLRSAWASILSDQSSLSPWRKLGFLATHWAHSQDCGRTLILLVLSWLVRGQCNFLDKTLLLPPMWPKFNSQCLQVSGFLPVLQHRTPTSGPLRESLQVLWAFCVLKKE